MTPESAEAIRISMERYIKERQSIYSEQLDEKVLKEQQQITLEMESESDWIIINYL